MSEFEKQKNRIPSSYLVRPPGLDPSPSRPAHDNNPLLTQQQTLGNQAMLRFTQSCPLRLPSASLCPTGGVCHTCPARVQAKLKIGQPGDKYEQEADRVADEVMRMPDSTGHSRLLHEDAPTMKLLQRNRAGCEEEIQRQVDEEEEEELLQAKEISSKIPEPNSSVEANINAVLSGGQPLPESVRSFFESRFDHNFRQVRVHTDAKAAEISKDLSARAFTIGHEIVFGPGQFAPNTLTGRRLLAHELTHVVQQVHETGTHPAVQCLGANPGCTNNERRVIHQAIFNARGWLNKAIPLMEATPLSTKVIRSLRRNFGPTYGVVANASLIARRLRVAYREISTIPFGCAGVTDATCATNACGYTAGAGSHSATICSNVTLTAGRDWRYQAGCVLHESFHAAFSRFTVDEYSGWHGVSGSTPTYPGAGTDPLLNADSYTTLVMDLS